VGSGGEATESLEWFGLANRIAAGTATQAEFDELSARIPSLVGATQNSALWAFSLGARPGPYFDLAFGRLCNWARGSEAELCQIMTVVSWRASPSLTPLAEPLARRLDRAEAAPLRQAAADTLYLAARNGMPIAPAFPALFEMLAEDDNRWFAAAFALGCAHKNGESFAAVADDVARTLHVRWESARIYLDLLRDGFSPPEPHKAHLERVLTHSKECGDAARVGLARMLENGHSLDDIVARVVKGMGGKTAKLARPAVAAAEGLVKAGIDFARFAPAFEKALSHKTTELRQRAHAAVAELSDAMSADERQFHRKGAAVAGASELAAALAKVRPPRVVSPRKPEPELEPPPPLTQARLRSVSRDLRGDSGPKRYAALAQVRRWLTHEPAQLASVLPPLIDALGTEQRCEVLDLLASHVHEGSSLTLLIPVVAGLLLDRDYYDGSTVQNLFKLIHRLAVTGHDIAPVWPWLGACMPNLGDTKRYLTIVEGIKHGLDGAVVVDYLRGRLVPVDRAVTRVDFVGYSLDDMAEAADCLARIARQQQELP